MKEHVLNAIFLNTFPLIQNQYFSKGLLQRPTPTVSADVYENSNPENRIALDDPRIPLSARNRLLVWYDSGNTIAFNIARYTTTDDIIYRISDRTGGLNPTLPNTSKLQLNHTSHQVFYNVKQENDNEDLVVEYGYDANNNNILDSDEITGTYLIYGVTAEEYSESRWNYTYIYLPLTLYDLADEIHKRFANGQWDGPLPLENDYRPNNYQSPGTAILSGNRFTHKFGANFTIKSPVEINDRKYPESDATVPVYNWDSTSAGAQKVLQSGDFENGVYNRINSGYSYSDIETLYNNASGGTTRSVTLSMNEASFAFGASGGIGLGGVVVNTSQSYNSSGTVTVSVTKNGNNYIISKNINVSMIIHDLFDFNYFNPSWLADYSDASRTAGMVQCGFNKTGAVQNAGQVGLIQINLSGAIELDSDITKTP